MRSLSQLSIVNFYLGESIVKNGNGSAVTMEEIQIRNGNASLEPAICSAHGVAKRLLINSKSGTFFGCSECHPEAPLVRGNGQAAEHLERMASAAWLERASSPVIVGWIIGLAMQYPEMNFWSLIRLLRQVREAGMREILPLPLDAR